MTLDSNTFLQHIPEQISPEIILEIGKVAHMVIPTNKLEFATALYKDLARRYRSRKEFHAALCKWGIETKEKMIVAIEAYIALRNDYPDMKFPPLSCFQKEEVGQIQEEVNDLVLFLIDNIVQKTQRTNRYDIMADLCDILEEKFGDDAKLDQNLKRMNIYSTKDVLHAIDFYLTMRLLFPETIFGRNRMHQSWDSILEQHFAHQMEKEVS